MKRQRKWIGWKYTIGIIYDREFFVDLTMKMQASQDFHYFTATQNFWYNHFESQPMMAFLNHGKKWIDYKKGITFRFSHIANYHHAIKSGT